MSEEFDDLSQEQLEALEQEELRGFLPVTSEPLPNRELSGSDSPVYPSERLRAIRGELERRRRLLRS